MNGHPVQTGMEGAAIVLLEGPRAEMLTGAKQLDHCAHARVVPYWESEWIVLGLTGCDILCGCWPLLLLPLLAPMPRTSEWFLLSAKV
jgi:hypothetical protein